MSSVKCLLLTLNMFHTNTLGIDRNVKDRVMRRNRQEGDSVSKRCPS